ncbi:MAG: hypothetical protein ABFS32_12685 [Bacteroidota bacterium]
MRNGYLFRQYEESDVVGYEVDGTPIAQEDLKKRVRAASERAEAGDHITQEDLEKEMEIWQKKRTSKKNSLMNLIMDGRLRLYQITLDELTNAPKRVRQIIETMQEHALEIFASDNESEELANKYLLDKAVTRKRSSCIMPLILRIAIL